MRKLLILFAILAFPALCADTVVSFNYGARWSSIVFDADENRLYLSVPGNGQQAPIVAALTQAQLTAILQAVTDYDGQMIRNELDKRDTDGDGVSDYVEISAGLKYWDVTSNFQNFTTDLTDVTEVLSQIRFLLCFGLGYCLWHCWDISARRKNFY